MEMKSKREPISGVEYKGDEGMSGEGGRRGGVATGD